MNSWRIITGEYAPQQGGVADYVANLARALAVAGDRVEVHVPGPWEGRVESGVTVRVLPDRFGPLSVAALQLLQRLDPAIQLLQHSPFSYGARGLNVLFPRLFRALPGHRVVMFHEVAYPREPGQPLRHALLAHAQRDMARSLLDGAAAACSSTSAWHPTLRELGWTREVTVLPIPSNLLPPPGLPPRDVLRRQLELPQEARLLGHFGTYGPAVAGPLRAAIPALLANPSRHLVLLGRGAAAFRTQLLGALPALAPRVHAPALEAPADLSRALCACDVLVQPYADGVTTRRTSFMAGPAHGLSTCTNRGPLTEEGWAGMTGVRLARDDSAAALAQVVDDALSADTVADGRAAAEAYAARFSMDHAVARLRALAGGLGSGT
jgi:glycosyltransferase involved in cell wall biosynthesis